MLSSNQWRAEALEHGAVPLIEKTLHRIRAQDRHFNAVSVLLDDEALATAAELDSCTDPGPLHGVPVLIKEEVHVRGVPTTYGTNANPTPAAADDEIVRRLRSAGAIILGKTTMPAFGAFPFTESEARGITRNPHDTRYTPGSSSGGSAVAVAAGWVPFAVGGDGGGSIRIPSAHCGLYGLKPARGTLPGELWCRLGTAGPIARTARDCALLFDALSDSEATETEVASLRIGVSLQPSTPLTPPHRDHVRAVRAMADRLRGMGHEVRDYTLQYKDPTAAFVTQFFAGIRKEIADLEFPERIERRHKVTRAAGVWAQGPVLRWAEGFSDRLGEQLDRVFDEIDVLLTPTVASRPARAGVLSGKGMLAAQIASLPSVAFTALWNVSGQPAMSIPAGRGIDGLPIGVQLVARDERLLLNLAASLSAP
ncbi:amidase family protein [uncultured Corynebacterium sp.]|uniref:amidase family protein n=1 Tax=uncultured Corynebacterium sp. TaxID=159447 RepID=UPI0025F6C8F0|nr:amidase family protein [uncultured Corynebacterium sp.]